MEDIACFAKKKSIIIEFFCFWILNIQPTTVRPSYQCLRFQNLHTIYSQLSSLTDCWCLTLSRNLLNSESMVLSSYEVWVWGGCRVLRSMISLTHLSFSMHYVGWTFTILLREDAGGCSLPTVGHYSDKLQFWQVLAIKVLELPKFLLFAWLELNSRE